MKESRNLWDLLRDNAALHGWDIHWSRIENLAGAGQADVNACCNGTEVWVELKVCHKGNFFKIRPSQVAWISKRVAHGGRVWVLVRKRDALYLYFGSSITMLVEQGLGVPPVLALHKPWDWNRLYTTIFSAPIRSVSAALKLAA